MVAIIILTYALVLLVAIEAQQLIATPRRIRLEGTTKYEQSLDDGILETTRMLDARLLMAETSMSMSIPMIDTDMSMTSISLSFPGLEEIFPIPDVDDEVTVVVDVTEETVTRDDEAETGGVEPNEFVKLEISSSSSMKSGVCAASVLGVVAQQLWM
jgi:hypothetical protein